MKSTKEIFIFALAPDKSANLLLKAIRNKQVTAKIIKYEKLSIYRNEIHYGSKKLELNNKLILLRDPYILGVNYSFYFRYIVENYYSQILLDAKCYKNFPLYEDKLFQALLFSNNSRKFNSLSMVKTSNYSAIEDFKLAKLAYPFIAKKRISSRSRDVHLIKSLKELELIIKSNKISDYIIQPLIPISNELRVVIYKGEIIATVEKQTKYQEGKELRCKLLQEFKIKDKKIINDCKKVAQVLQADFLGVDIARDSNNRYYLIEANLGPGFSGLSKITKEDPIEIVANDIVRYDKNTM